MKSKKNVKSDNVTSYTPNFPPNFTSTPTLSSQNFQNRRKVHWGPSVSLESLLKGTNKRLSAIDKDKRF